MYAYIKGEDNHLCFQWFRTRRDAEEWLHDEIILYNICYTNPEYAVLTNRQFENIFTDDVHQNKICWRRLGDKLLKKLDQND